MSARVEMIQKLQVARGSGLEAGGNGVTASGLSSQRGLTLIEVLIGSFIGAVLVAGLMAAFLTSLRITSAGQGNTEAAALAQQTLERFRNMVACGEGNPGEWFDPTCGATGLPPADSFDPADPLDGLPPGALYGPGASRTYTVTPDDCDGIDGLGDCFKVVAKVSWTQPQ